MVDNRQKKIGFFPGKFHPPHLGHVRTIMKLCSQYEQLIVGVSEDIPQNQVMEPSEVIGILREVLPQGIQIISIKGKLIDKTTIEGLPDFDVVLSGNPDVINWAKNLNVPYRFIERTKGLMYDSSIIRDNVAVEDMDFLKNNLKLLKRKDLKFYENNNLERTALLYKKILKDKVFLSPILVTKEGLVIDGNNRVAALKALSIHNIPAVVVNYEDIELDGNIHYLEDYPEETIRCIERFARRGQLTTEEPLDYYLTFEWAGQVYWLPKKSILEDLGLINEFVSSYQGMNYERLSERPAVSRYQIRFKALLRTETQLIADSGKLLESGITWHRSYKNIARIKVPLNALGDRAIFRKIIRDSIKHARCYRGTTYICDEWQ